MIIMEYDAALENVSSPVCTWLKMTETLEESEAIWSSVGYWRTAALGHGVDVLPVIFCGSARLRASISLKPWWVVREAYKAYKASIFCETDRNGVNKLDKGITKVIDDRDGSKHFQSLKWTQFLSPHAQLWLV